MREQQEGILVKRLKLNTAAPLRQEKAAGGRRAKRQISASVSTARAEPRP